MIPGGHKMRWVEMRYYSHALIDDDDMVVVEVYKPLASDFWTFAGKRYLSLEAAKRAAEKKYGKAEEES